MTTYIIWSKEIDETFRPDYLMVTGEQIQDDAQETKDGKYFVGSSRVTPDHCALLSKAYAEGVSFSNEAPEV